MKKRFECKPKCEKRYLEMLVYGCKKCIRKTAVKLTKKQIEEISVIKSKKQEL